MRSWSWTPPRCPASFAFFGGGGGGMDARDGCLHRPGERQLRRAPRVLWAGPSGSRIAAPAFALEAHRRVGPVPRLPGLPGDRQAGHHHDRGVVHAGHPGLGRPGPVRRPARLDPHARDRFQSCRLHRHRRGPQDTGREDLGALRGQQGDPRRVRQAPGREAGRDGEVAAVDGGTRMAVVSHRLRAVAVVAVALIGSAASASSGRRPAVQRPRCRRGLRQERRSLVRWSWP